MTWCRQATSHHLDQCLAKFVYHYQGANELIYSQTVAELTDFYLVVCMASNLICRKQRFGSTSIIHLSIRRDSVGPLSHQRWSGVFVARVIALHWPRLGAPVSPLCFADHAVKQSVMHAPGFAAASATPGSQWHKTMLGQSHQGINSYKGRHKQRNVVNLSLYTDFAGRLDCTEIRRRRHTQEFTGQGRCRDTTVRTRLVSFRLSRCGANTWLHRPHTGSLWSGGFGLCRWLRTGNWTSSGHIRTLNTLVLKHMSHAHRRTTTFPAIPPLEPDWIAPKPVTSYTRIHRVGIRRVELDGYFFGSPEWIHCLAPSTAGREFVAWCVLTVPMA